MAKTIKQILEMVAEASLKDIKSPTAAKKEIAAAKKEMARMDKLGRLLPHEASKYRQLARKVKVASGWLKEGASPDADHQQNKRHHGNTRLELEGAPTKVRHRKYVGPVKKVPGGLKEGQMNEAKKPSHVKMQSYGATEVHHYSDGSIHVSHAGNMGARMKDVEHGVDKILGKGSFKKLHANKTKETGHPDYEYGMTSHKKHLGEGLLPKQVYSPMISPDSEVAKRTGGLKGKNMTKDKKRLMGMSALRVKGAQIRTEDHSK